MLCLKDLFVFLFCLVSLIAKSSHGAEIINGKEVTPHSLPFMALLKRKTPVCGGILIDPEWVLTAAHCIDPQPADEDSSNIRIEKVSLGVHAINKAERDSRQVREVQCHDRHPKYKDVKQGNDLMLLKLDKPVTQTKTVEWLKLGNSVKDPKAGTNCLVAGWGKTKNNAKKMSDVLMSANVTVIDRVKCNSKEYYNRRPVISDIMICAGSNSKFHENGADTCVGDSGGPLLCNGALVGVTSFGPEECGQKKKPGVFSFLTKKQLKWIKKTLKKSDIE